MVRGFAFVVLRISHSLHNSRSYLEEVMRRTVSLQPLRTRCTTFIRHHDMVSRTSLGGSYFS